MFKHAVVDIGNTAHLTYAAPDALTIRRAQGYTEIEGYHLLAAMARERVAVERWVDVGAMVSGHAAGHLVKVSSQGSRLWLRLDDWPDFTIEVDRTDDDERGAGHACLYLPGSSWPAVLAWLGAPSNVR